MPVLDKQRRKKLQKIVDRDYGYREYEDEDVIVKSRGKVGLGVIAARQFFPGELIMEIHGQLMRKDEYEGSCFVMDLDEEYLLEPTVPATFLNHSCNPNSELIQLSDVSLGLVAICNIEEGTELCFDYQWEAADWLPRCGCGARNCRGWVVEKDGVKKMRRLTNKKKARKPR